MKPAILVITIVMIAFIAIGFCGCRQSASIPPSEFTPPSPSSVPTQGVRSSTVSETPAPEAAQPVATPEIPAPDATQSVQPAQQEITVYITRTGERYHCDGCSSLSRSRIPITLTEARQRGYTPCHRCNPPN